MIFLMEYHRPTGSIKSLREFSDADEALAQKARLERELELRREGVFHEVVLLQAVNVEALRKTHRRYFENPQQLSTG
jgi:hypothetical protein